MTETHDAAPVDAPVEAAAVTESPVDTAAAEAPSEAPPEAAKTEEPEAPKPEGKKDWRETRIDQLTREKHEARREAERYRALAEAAQQKPGEDGKPAPGYVPETEIERRAAQMAEQREYAAKVQSWADRGAKEFKDFNDRCATVAGLGLAPAEKPEFMAVIADMDDGHKLVAHLADHPDAAMALARQPVHKMALELAKLSASLNKPAQISKAPAPVSAPAGKVATAPSLYDDKLSASDWAEQFAKTTKLKGIRR